MTTGKCKVWLKSEADILLLPHVAQEQAGSHCTESNISLDIHVLLPWHSHLTVTGTGKNVLTVDVS